MFLFPNTAKKTSYIRLKEKWENKHRLLHQNLWEHHQESLEKFFLSAKRIFLSSLAGAVLLTSPSVSHLSSSTTNAQQEEQFTDLSNQSKLMIDLFPYVPQEVRSLSPGEENAIAQILSEHLGFRVTPELQNIRLNTTYGLIGQEQHLSRYPGDTLEAHFTNPQDAKLYEQYGIAPGLGAYGYFANSKEQLTQEDILREKYYIAVQTFLAPGYNNDPKTYNTFFAFRKMVVVNPQNGKAIVVDIADAGPSPWTGKQLGGSPAVMHYLQRKDGADRGPVLYFFIDDPTNSIPLGPVAF